jgi:serine protease Do
MRIRRYGGVAGTVAFALTLMVMPGIHGQGKPAPAPAATPTPAAAPMPSKSRALPVSDACGSSAEQLVRQSLETIEMELASKMEGIERQVVREVEEMEPEKLARLQEVKAAIAGAQQEAQAPQAELEAQAEEMAGEAALFGAEGQVWVDGGEESGWLGVEIAEVTAEKAKELNLPSIRGVLISEVEAESPAAKAGLKANDVVVGYDGQNVEGTLQFRRMVRETPPGRSIPLDVWRSGKSEKLSIEVGNRAHVMGRGMKELKSFVVEMPSMDLGAVMPRFEFGITPQLGISAEDISGQLGTYFSAPDGDGVLVREVRPGTPAEKAGLKAGDIIFKVDDQPVKTVNQLRERLRGKREQKTVALGIVRKGSPMSVNVEIETPKPAEHKRIARSAAL